MELFRGARERERVWDARRQLLATCRIHVDYLAVITAFVKQLTAEMNGVGESQKSKLLS